MRVAYVVLITLFVFIACCDAVSKNEQQTAAFHVSESDIVRRSRFLTEKQNIDDKRSLRSDDTIVDDEERAISIPGLEKLQGLVNTGTAKARQYLDALLKKGSTKLKNFISDLEYKRWVRLGMKDTDITRLWRQQGKSGDDIYKLWFQRGKTTDDIYGQLTKIGYSDEAVYKVFLKQGQDPNAIYKIWEKQGKTTTDTLRIWRQLGNKDEDLYKLWVQSGKTTEEMNDAWLSVSKKPDDVYRLLNLHRADPRDSPHLNQYIRYRNSYNRMMGISNM